jgi:hypothetical protein
MSSRFKDVFIADEDNKPIKYQISKLPVATAMWIASQVIVKMLPPGMEAQLGLPVLPFNRSAMTEEDFSDLIHHCMMACKRYQVEESNGVEYTVPVMATKGIWSIPEIEVDPAVVISLVVNVLEFNISAFFAERVLKVYKETFKGITLFRTLR